MSPAQTRYLIDRTHKESKRVTDQHLRLRSAPAPLAKPSKIVKRLPATSWRPCSTEPIPEARPTVAAELWFALDGGTEIWILAEGE